MSEITTPTLEQNFETAMSAFEGILKKGDSNRGSLWLAWHYLQFYSVWGLRLPHTEEMLGKALGVDEPGRYTFFPTMQHSYTQVFETSQFFYNQVFDKIVALGGQLKDFAEKQSDGDRNMFAVILDHIHSGDINSAMEFLQDMVAESEEHTERATVVSGLLKDYYDKLKAAQDLLAKTSALIEEDPTSSKKAIELLEGGPEVIDSIANIHEQMEAIHKEYVDDVIIATTTSVTTVWYFPIGPIIAGIMAGVFGDRAVKALAEYERRSALAESASNRLAVAKKTQEVQTLASNGVNKAMAHTEIAMTQTDIVKVAWGSVRDNLAMVEQKLKGMTTDNGEEDILRATDLIETFATTAAQRWSALMPSISQLTDNPYLVVSYDDEQSAELIKKVQAELDSTSSN